MAMRTAPTLILARGALRPPTLASRQRRRWLFTAVKEALKGSTSIVGTVPYHTSYTLLRHPHPPSAYPAKLDARFSPLYRDLTLQAKMRGAGGLVNFWWDPEAEEADGDEPAFAREGEGEGGAEVGTLGEDYPVTVFGAPGVEVDETELMQERERGQGQDGALLLVCTHGARDCRCGDTGGALVRALREELAARRRDDSKSGEHDVWSKVRVGEIAHVGGHKYAANLLAFPSGDWLGNLTPSHASLVLDAVAAQLHVRLTTTAPAAGGTSQPTSLAPLIADPTLWRGRMGLTKEEQIRLLDAHA
ncbi:hypothetical protein M0805_003122 [Coniferiporia weirii]|nr:hypothetical protein M0805_003122 [Coniferiporia weirii]